tara:strand:+ start:203 stop:397 length:195 start_codon:yes stop_codon:yes gene_type:complete
MVYLSANLGAVVASGAGGRIAENHGWPQKASFIAVLVFVGRKLALIFLIDGCSMLGLISISPGA